MMRHISYYLLAAATALSLSACSHDDHDHDHDHEGHDHATEEVHDHDHDHGDADHHEDSDEIKLKPETAARFGLATETVQPGAFAQVIKVTGQIVDSPGSTSVVTAPTSGIVRFASSMQPGAKVANGSVVANISASNISGGDRNAADQAALDAAKRELDRLTPLYEERIVSERDYNAAREAYERAKAQYSPAAAAGVARAVSAGVISDLLVSNGQYVEAGTPIATVSANQRLTLRADVPDRYQASVPLLTGARVRLPFSDEVVDIAALNGRRVSGGDASMRVERGYIPVYFAFDNGGRTLPQTLVEVYLTGAPRAGVLSVPVGAVYEQQGARFVYEQLDDECYRKLPVTTGASDGVRVEILSGLTGGECVVTEGVTAVRLAETSAVAPEGHSHNH